MEIRPDPEGPAGVIDEIVVKDATIHVERMNAGQYWMGVKKGKRYWTFCFTRSGKEVRMTGGED